MKRYKQNKLLAGATSLLTGLCLAVVSFTGFAQAAGTLTPTGSAKQPIEILDHHVHVVVHGSFAKTEVTQTFFNPNSEDLEAIYTTPVPKHGALSEFAIYVGETEIEGEVVARQKANEIYEKEKSSGNDAGVANKNSYQNYEFKIAKVQANGETRIRFTYYQPLELDTGVGKYVYPLEEGGTDDVGSSFWTRNEKVENSFSASFDLRVGYPIDSVRVPGFEAATTITEVSEGHSKVDVSTQGASLNRDLVLYYGLSDQLPGRVDLVSYKAEKDKPGTFLLSVTPGVDLQPVSSGSDFTFVLDNSGSMKGKLHTLISGVKRSISEMRPEDRFRVVVFNSTASYFTNDWLTASESNVAKVLGDLDNLRSEGGTNVYDGLRLALDDLDDDRVQSIILVTDGVTNQGIVNPKEFAKLLTQVDVRIFGFLLGNSSNWPLMRVIAEESGGFYTGVSNADDILGQIMLAKSKITHESMHDAELTVKGVKVFDVTDEFRGKVYRGQQLMMLGRYEHGGKAKVSLKARLSGEDKTYTTTIDLPEIATEFPELERLWAFERIEEIEYERDLGKIVAAESETAIRDLGVAYQLVTDETSMLVLSDEAFTRHGIKRLNKTRSTRERAAHTTRYSQPVRSPRADQSQPMFGNKRAPNVFSGGGSGGGAIDPLTGLLLGGFGAAALRRRKKNQSGARED